MEATLILLFAGLAVIFLVLWLASSSRTDSYGKLANEIHGINDTMQRIAYKMPYPLDSSGDKAAESVPDPESAGKPVTAESIRMALHYNGIAPGEPDSDDPDVLYFSYKGRRYRLNYGGLPYISILLIFSLKPEEEDIELMKEAAQSISLRSYGACVFVIPEDGCFLISEDIYADSYLYLRNNIRFFLEAIDNTGRFFYDRYEQLKDEKQKASQNAINSALLAAQNELNGKKIPS